MATLKNESKQAVNEFDQELKGNSLGKDAWKRLKKNKMAVLSIVVVTLYAFLSLAAPILPIYSYKEIIMDHQHLRPSLTKTAGELMIEKKLKDLYFMAWRNGRYEISAEEEAKVEQMSPNQKWDYFYALGQQGLIPLTDQEQRSLARMQEKIDTELQYDIKRIDYVADSGKRVKLTSLDSTELAGIYSMVGGDSVEEILERANRQILQQVSSQTKVENDGIPEEEMEKLVAKTIENLTDKQKEELLVSNISNRIAGEIEDFAEDELEQIVEAGNQKFPLTITVDVNDRLSAKVSASKLHDRRYYLGTDYSGRDMLSRIIYGGQVSIAIGFIGTITSVLIGIIVGAFAGYLGGKVDYILMRIVDVIYGLPYMLLVIIMMAIFGRNILNLFFALAIVSWLTVARMVRGQIISLKNSEFVEAARSMGASTSRIIFKHLVPNSLGVIIVFSTLRIPAFIMMESFLSFLGLGVQAPYASWGSLVGSAVEGMALYPWRLLFPALAMTIFLFAMNFLGDGLRDAFDPQSKNQL